MLLPIETSAPTYRKMAAAPRSAHREVNAVKTEASLAAAAGAVAASSRWERQMKTNSRIINPAIRRKDVSTLRRDASLISAVSTAAPPEPENNPPRNINADPRYGPMTVPKELKACEKVSLKCDRSGGPSAATSGLAATCRTVIPEAMTKSATSTSS